MILAVGGLLLAPVVDPGGRGRTPDPQSLTIYNMRSIALAMLTYADQHKRFPPAAIHDQDGRPLLSWRVLLLPLLEQEDLFKEFHLDEPWDGPHNRTLLPRMPKVYAPPPLLDQRSDPSTTFYQVFIGEGAAFEGHKGLRPDLDFPDGSSRTILIAEAAQAVPWTKPSDLPFRRDGPLPPLGGVFTGPKAPIKGAFIFFGDGSGDFFPADLDEAALRAAVTRNGGERIGLK
jgi:hypothetical protein